MSQLSSSVVSYPDRGHWGNNKYRGNCTGHLIKDIIEHYKPKMFIEIFAGGGTGFDVCKELNQESIHLDLRPEFGGWNALRDEIPTGGDLVFSHPPYADMVIYSGEMWGESHPDDLSRSCSYDEFIHKLNLVNAKIYNSLRKGGRHAMLIGDMRREGRYYSMIKDLVWYGDLDVHIIKTQHNTVSDRKTYRNPLIRIQHEHLLIFRKNEVWGVTLKITKTEKRNLLQSKLITWRDLVQSALEDLGGSASLSAIYEVVSHSDKTSINQHWKAKVRQTLQLGNEFVPVKRGMWSLCYNSNNAA
ncbi:hypothetical protein JOD82_001919 [Paenibacillus sp. 1182]|uniref:hypothetical protein n=1 Tax=Paenibacillus sp. 1182 TaxID=2806565 RepID=UPI001AE5C5BF|nr:hypothetical protein [Paenibacillus sp. 1182]MBP1308899.1 hypothetical protein [Paenibacillus sp. 1182]